MIKSNDLIVKSNSLVEARYKFLIWEVRVFAKMITMIKKNDKEFNKYRIDIKELMNFFGTKSHSDYERIREVPDSLMGKKVKIPFVDAEGRQRLFTTPLITSATQPNDETLKENNTFFELTFHPDLKEYLLELQERLLQYDIKNVLRISSVHSVRIYELLKQYEKIGKRVFEVDELKEILGIEGKYKRYHNFKKRILDQAEKDLKENTDIYFVAKPKRRGRTFYAIEFEIFKNKKNSFQTQKSQETKAKEADNLIKDSLLSLTKTSFSEAIIEEKDENIGAIVLLLINEGIAPDTANSLVERFGAAEVQEELAYAKETIKTTINVKSRTGFIIRMIENQTFTELQKYKSAQLAKAQEAAKAQEIKRTAQKNQIQELRAEYTQVRNNAVKSFLKGKSKGEVNALIGEYALSEPFIKKAIDQAERLEDKETANDFKYLLVAKRLDDKKLWNFDNYLALQYESKLERDERGEYLVVL